jgi:REP element-mobilizing transposase RayT
MQPGEFYHIYNRGNNHETIFKEEKNYYYFLKKFHQYLNPFVSVHAYCLMPNHFHFILQIKDSIKSTNTKKAALTPIEKAFRDFFICYAKAINKGYGRTGSLFQYKFKRKYIEGDIQYANNIAYVHFNPPKAGLSNNCKDWKFSSYNAFLNDQPTKVDRKFVLNWFGNRALFMQFHEEYWQNWEEREQALNLSW